MNNFFIPILYKKYRMENFMKKKKSIILMIAILIVICIISAITVTLIKKEKTKNNKEVVIKLADTTVEQRKVWNDFLNSNPYLSQIQTIPYLEDTDFIKLAITSDNVVTERIVREEIEEKPSLTMGDGYKK